MVAAEDGDYDASRGKRRQQRRHMGTGALGERKDRGERAIVGDDEERREVWVVLKAESFGAAPA